MKWFVFVAVLIPLIGWSLVRKRYNNNVCRTFEDYYTDRDSNENCYYNPDSELEVPDIVQRHGYPSEKYHVTTKDGYILTVFRIPYGKNSIDKSPGKPVFLQHGMTLNSNSYVNTGQKSLGFILADAGYDVWLGNFRGAVYSRNHTHVSESESKFWEFSFHEHGVYDLPAQLDLVYQVTKQKIVFIGYSLGSTAAYVYGSVYSSSAQEKVKIFINLAPSIYMDDLGGVFKLIGHVWPYLESLVQFVTNGKLFPKHPMPSTLVKLLCLPFPFQMKMCQFPEMAALGFDFAQNDPETLPITIQQNSDTASVKTVTHMCQLGHSGRFQYFDYGKETNKQIYGTVEPKPYNLSDVKVPSYTILAENDFSVTTDGIKKLYNILPKETTRHGVHTIEYKNFNHLDFLAAKDVVPLLYEHIVTFLSKL